MTTLQDIADHLGLSRATVSRALNGYPEVGKKTRERVEQAALALHYTPNLNAKQLATGRTGMVAMMLLLEHDQIQDLNHLEFMSGISLAVQQCGLDMIFHVVTQADDLDTYRRFLSRRAVDGMILNRPQNNDPRVPLLQANGMPFVMHGRADGNVPYAFYDIDNEAAFSHAARLLLDLGHQRLVFINGPKRMSYAQQRTRGVAAQLSSRQIQNPELHCQFFYTDLTEDEGYQVAYHCLSQTQPTAFLCSSTPQAAGVYRAASQLGLQIGKDLAVIAHDDELPHWRSINFQPTLTVTRSPIRAACEPLARIITRLIAGAEPHTLQQTIMPELIVRESSSPIQR